MKLFNINFTISNEIFNEIFNEISKPIRSLRNKIPLLFSRIDGLMTQVWERIKGNPKFPTVESFVSHIKDYDFKLVNPQKVTNFDLETYTPKVEFDRMLRTVESQELRTAMDNQESAFFEDDFVSSSDWAKLAAEQDKSLHSFIELKIKDAVAIKKFLTLKIQKESDALPPKLNLAKKQARRSTLSEKQSHKDLLTNLQKEKEKDLQNRLDTLKQNLEEKKRPISTFKSSNEKYVDQFIKDISHANARFGIQDKKIYKQTRKLAEERKNFINSVAKKSLQKLDKEFAIQSSKIEEEVHSKFEEKEKVANQNFKEKLQSIQENLQREKQIITELSDKQVTSLKSEIQSLGDKLLNLLKNPSLQHQITESGETISLLPGIEMKIIPNKEKEKAVYQNLKEKLQPIQENLQREEMTIVDRILTVFENVLMMQVNFH